MVSTLNTEALLNASMQIFTIGKWNVRSLPYPLLVQQFEREKLEQAAMTWAPHFIDQHQNWMTENFNVPSILIRFDYVIDSENELRIFEIEDRPAALEVSALNNPQTFAAFESALEQCMIYSSRKVGICVSKQRMYNSDDYFWTQRFRDPTKYRIVLGEVPRDPGDALWFVRSLRTEAEYYSLSSHALSTIQYEGDKSYGVRMGLWKEIGGDITWLEPFVVKPDAGCGCENVHLFHPKKPGGGYSTRGKIEQAIQRKEVRYIQPYFSPEQPDFLPEGYAMIRRCYLVFDIPTRSYKVIGGQWQARPSCHKIHGASDSVCGPLVL